MKINKYLSELAIVV